MKLSEAIRLGAMVSEQAFEAFFRDDMTCALASAVVATGGNCDYRRETVENHILVRWPWVFTDQRTCPGCGLNGYRIDVVIIHLNDSHRWSREAIADWVATIEPQEIAAVPSPHPTDLASPAPTEHSAVLS